LGRERKSKLRHYPRSRLLVSHPIRRSASREFRNTLDHTCSRASGPGQIGRNTRLGAREPALSAVEGSPRFWGPGSNDHTRTCSARRPGSPGMPHLILGLGPRTHVAGRTSLPPHPGSKRSRLPSRTPNQNRPWRRVPCRVLPERGICHRHGCTAPRSPTTRPLITDH
jgi:hypothetical protein